MSQQVRGADSLSMSKATGQHAHAVGNSTASGTQAHAEGTAVASSTTAHAEGSSTASNISAHAEGQSCTASAIAAHAEGNMSAATGVYGHAEGQKAEATRFAQHAKASGVFAAAAGDAQYSNYTHMATTTTAAATVLTSAGTAVSTANTAANVLTLPAARAFQFRADAIARRTDVAGETAAFVISGAVVRDATGAPRIVGTVTTNTWADTAAATWTLTTSIVTVSGTVYYLAFTATGEAGKTIRWVSTLHTTEVG